MAKYDIVFDNGKPWDDEANSDEELFQKLKDFHEVNRKEDMYYDVFVFNSEGIDITDSQFIQEMAAEIMGDD
jgi:hypothetical protein